jgi:dolichol-phosphate mannosyltransferase
VPGPPSAQVTVVIAAKNEAPTIGEIVSACRRYATRVLVVDGHSADGTREAASAAGADVILDRGRGKGDALRVAVGAVRTDITVFIDADGSHDPDDVPRLVAPILAGKADHVSGSRLIGGSSELHGGFDEFLRLAGSSFITACINWRFGVVLSESQNGLRAIRTNVLRALDLRENSTTIEQEMVIKTLRLGFTMGEVPTHEHKRRHGVSHIVLWRVAPRYVFSFVWYLFFWRPPVRSAAEAAAGSGKGPRLPAAPEQES